MEPPTGFTKRAQTAIIAMCALVCLSFAGSGYALIDRFGQTNQRRHDQILINQHFRKTLVNLLCFSREFSLNSKPPLRPEQLLQVNRYYNGALRQIGATLNDCPGGTP
jgi:hypothetical protein